MHEDGWRPSWGAVLMLAARLASALACVHGAGLVHRDIKAGNVLMDAQDRAHLADFGLSELLVNLQGTKVAAAPSGGFHKQRMVGTLQYMAPEVLQNNHHTQVRTPVSANFDSLLRHVITKTQDGTASATGLARLEAQPLSEPSQISAILHALHGLS